MKSEKFTRRLMPKALLVLLFALLVPWICSASAEGDPAVPPIPPGSFGEPVPQGEREWTIIAYFDGDNNLEIAALQDLKELEAGFAGSKVEVVVLLDRSKEFTTAMGDWSGTRAFRLKKSSREDNIDSLMLADFGELNMGDPAVLESFIREAVRVFPSPKTALFMWDHGAGWINMANDDDAPGAEGGTDEVTLAEFRDVLKNISPLLPGKKLDLIFFDMCLMGQAETVAACAPYASFMVGAAPTIPGVGMN